MWPQRREHTDLDLSIRLHFDVVHHALRNDIHIHLDDLPLHLIRQNPQSSFQPIHTPLFPLDIQLPKLCPRLCLFRRLAFLLGRLFDGLLAK